MEKNILDIFHKLIFSESLSIRRDICFGVSNICVANSEQINQLFGHDLLNEMIKLAFLDDITVLIISILCDLLFINFIYFHNFSYIKFQFCFFSVLLNYYFINIISLISFKIFSKFV